MAKEAIMTRTVLGLALTLLPVSGDAAMLRASLPSHLPAPHEVISRVRNRAVPRVRAPRRAVPPRARASPRTLRAAAPPAWAGDRQTVAPQLIHVHDGDTFSVGVETIRLRGIDTPELGQPRASEAKRRLIELLRTGPVTIMRRAEDVYGRIVADVSVGGRDVASVLQAEGHAKPLTPGGARTTATDVSISGHFREVRRM
jgi:micrococcal nuclease